MGLVLAVVIDCRKVYSKRKERPDTRTKTAALLYSSVKLSWTVMQHDICCLGLNPDLDLSKPK